MELSQRVLGLKFMQRKAERERRKSLEVNREQGAQWVAQQTTSPFIMLAEVQLDYADTFRPLPRRSYKKFNPAVEKMQQEMRIKLASSTKKRKGASISREEMAKRMGKIQREEEISEESEEEEE
jgi:hypothetical protein